MTTQGATDTDMNVFPPEGVTVIISNDTVTVTNQAVDIGTAEEEEDEPEEDTETEESDSQGTDSGVN